MAWLSRGWPWNDGQVALTEVAAQRARQRRFEKFLLSELERVRLRVRLLEIGDQERKLREERAKSVHTATTVRYDFDQEVTPVRGMPREPK